jgi:alginate O-acetyltransferase complex protein AlgJ
MNLQQTPKHTLLCAAVFSALMVVGGYQVMVASFDSSTFDLPKGFTAFREGVTTQSLEKQVDKKLPFRAASIATANAVRYTLLGGGGEQVRTGKADWLFLTEELKYEGPTVKSNVDGKSLDPVQSLKVRVDLISGLAKRLETQGVRLVVALVPDKARLYSSFLSGGIYPSYNESRYQEAFDALNSNRVSTVNLLAAMAPLASKSDLYYRTDTHWNQFGAAIAADQIAAQIQAFKLDLSKSQFRTEPMSKSVLPKERAGDLLRLMGLEFVPNAFRPKPDLEIEETSVEVPGAKAGSGLFDEANVPVALVGTSYSLRANFHGRLQQALSAKVLNTAKDGGGFLQSMTAYLKDESFRQSKPHVIVWEIPERMLKSPLSDEAGWLKKVF